MTAARLAPAVRMILRITGTDIIGSQRKRVARIKASTTDVIRDRGGAGIPGLRINARWVRDFLAYDPRRALARINVPVLAITGGQDVQVPPEDVAAIGRLVQGPFEGHVAGDLSHLFRPDPASAGPRAYRHSVRQPVDAAVLRLITGWITTHWRSGSIAARARFAASTALVRVGARCVPGIRPRPVQLTDQPSRRALMVTAITRLPGPAPAPPGGRRRQVSRGMMASARTANGTTAAARATCHALVTGPLSPARRIPAQTSSARAPINPIPTGYKARDARGRRRPTASSAPISASNPIGVPPPISTAGSHCLPIALWPWSMIVTAP